jgi:hypothetical protein
MGEQEFGSVERRRHDRAKIHMEAVLERLTPGDFVRLTILDFSVGGFFCRSSQALEPGTLLGVTFQFPPYAERPSCAIEGRAAIVRCEPPSETGNEFQVAAAFTELSREAREHIRGYVEWYELVYGESGLAAKTEEA